MGQKASDYDTMPLCRTHHETFHGGAGYFVRWDRQQRREWQLEQVAATQAILGLLAGG